MVAFALTGCSLIQGRGTIKTQDATVIGPRDAGKSPMVDSDKKSDTITLPPQTTVTMTKFEAIPATSTTPFQPAREMTVFTAPFEVKWDRTQSSVHAESGTIDTSITKARIQAEESRILLYAAIGAAIIAGFFIYKGYPGPAFMSGCAAAVFMMAWKVSNMPDWAWGIGAVGIAAAVFLYLGHERGSNSLSSTKSQ